MSLDIVKEFFKRDDLTVEDMLVYLLAKVYLRVDWGKIARGRDPLDVFQHRVLAAAYMPDFRRFLSKLCLGLGIQGLRVEPEVLEVLDRNSQKVLDELRHSSHYYCVCAYELAMYIRRVKSSTGR